MGQRLTDTFRRPRSALIRRGCARLRTPAADKEPSGSSAAAGPGSVRPSGQPRPRRTARLTYRSGPRPGGIAADLGSPELPASTVLVRPCGSAMSASGLVVGASGQPRPGAEFVIVQFSSASHALRQVACPANLPILRRGGCSAAPSGQPRLPDVRADRQPVRQAVPPACLRPVVRHQQRCAVPAQ